MSNSRKSILKWTGLAAIVLLLGFGSVFALNLPGLGNNDKVEPVNGAVTIPVADVANGEAHFFRFADGGKDISFFVVKGTDGTFHVAFDTCDVCFQEKKGYYQEGNFMVCRNCSKKFATNQIGRVGGGGCNPSHLNFAQNEKNIIIQTEDLKLGNRFF